MYSATGGEPELGADVPPDGSTVLAVGEDETDVW